jgi:hypothetical protein
MAFTEISALEPKSCKSDRPIDFRGGQIGVGFGVPIENSAVGNHLAKGKGNAKRLHEFAIGQGGYARHRP